MGCEFFQSMKAFIFAYAWESLRLLFILTTFKASSLLLPAEVLTVSSARAVQCTWCGDSIRNQILSSKVGLGRG